jgi:hypothetical protein
MEQVLTERLAQPFPLAEVKWKAQVVRGNRALTVAYVDARCVEDRLDAVFGVDGWQDAYQVLPNNSVVCKLRVKVGSEWIEKSDVGSQSEQPDEGDRLKSAFSDALKRAAVKLGIGRYLYRLPQQWVDYDAQTRQIKTAPKLPDWAQPREAKPQRRPAAAKADGAPASITREQWDRIKANLVKNHISQRKFLDHFKVRKPGELPQTAFEEAMGLSLKPSEALLVEAAPAA